MRVFRLIGGVAFLCAAAFSQSGEAPSAPPQFEAADIHPSAPSLRAFVSGPYIHGTRYELRNAAMVDLIHTAYGVDGDKVLGGPSWLEFDRFDLMAKAPTGTKPDDLKAMLQALLADRFKLVVHTDSKPYPAYSLVAGKNPRLKESDGSGDSQGCTFRVNVPPPGPGGERPPGPMAMTFITTCHSATMASFVNSIRGFVGDSQRDSAPPPVLDNTGLKGTYDFELKFTPLGLETTNNTPIAEAVDKQLGLKLETIQVPMPVVLVDSASRKPTENSPDVARNFPPLPAEFEVASIKPGAPVPAGGRGRVPTYQNDRVHLQNNTLKQLINLAWNITGDDMVVGMPKFAESDRYDLMAKVPAPVAAISTGGRGGPTDVEAYRPMYRALLIDRFQMKVHYEDRPMNAYVLTAVKPKLQKADPASRTKCMEGPGADGKDPRKANPQIGRLLTCQNITMAEFAVLLPSLASGYVKNLVKDATGLEGSWDFTLNFSPAGMVGGGPVLRGVDPGQAADPSGGLSLFDAIGKQLGLKLEVQKRPMAVLVIDHIEQRPTDN